MTSTTHMGHFAGFFLLVLVGLFVCLPAVLVSSPALSYPLAAPPPPSASCVQRVDADGVAYAWCS